MSTEFLPPMSIAPLGDSEGSIKLPYFDELFHLAVDHIQSASGAPAWTDFNLHDPGVTLLEAIVWAMSDLSYRSELGAHWDRRISLREPPAFPCEPTSTREEVAPREHDPQALQDEQEPTSEITETSRQLWLQFLMDGFDQLFPEDSFSDRADHVHLETVLREKWGRFIAGVPQWKTETAPPNWNTLVNQIRISLLEELPFALKQEIAERIRDEDHGTPLLDDLGKTLGWAPTPSEVLELAADFSFVDFPPARLEDGEGRSLIWPPHRRQMLSVAPCNQEDYLNHLTEYLRRYPYLDLESSHPAWQPERDRAWVQTGLATGVLWDGQFVYDANPQLSGAVTILLDPPSAGPRLQSVTQAEASSSHRGFLEHCRLAFYSDESETPRRYWGHEAINSEVEVHRCLCDELCIAIVGRTNVHLRGRILHAPELRSDDVRDRVRRFLTHFFYFGNELPPGVDDPSFDDRAPRQGILGWLPGEPLRLSDLRRELLNLEGIEQVTGLSAAEDSADRDQRIWYRGQLDLPAFTVPERGEWNLVFQSILAAS